MKSRKNSVKVVALVVVVWIIVAGIVWKTEAQSNPVALIDSPLYGHSQISGYLLDKWGIDFVLYQQGVVIELYRAAKEGRTVILIPAWLDNVDVRGDCLPLRRTLVVLEAIKYASQTAEILITANDCYLFDPHVTRVAAVDKEGNRPNYLLFVDTADRWVFACSLGYCSDSEAVLKSIVR